MRDFLRRYQVKLCIMLAIVITSSTLLVANGQSETKGVDAPVTLKLAHTVAVDHPYHKAMVKMAEIVETRSGGALKIQIFPSGQMGNLREMLESISLGTLDMGYPGSAHVGKYNARFSIFQTPYIATDVDQMLRAASSPLIAEEIEKTAKEANIRVLSFPYSGTRHITTSNKPIYTPADMEGLKIRTPELPMTMEFMRMVGASPTPMSLSELYLALQQGVVDGQENPVTTIYYAKLHEVQKYLNLSSHIILLQAIVIGENVYQKLTPEQRTIVKEAADEAAVYQRKLIEDGDSKILENIKNEGVTVVETDVNAFRTATKGIVDKFEKDWGAGFANQLFDN